ncbi:MAG: methyltransferase domain-containing protein [Verrucomicrobia bacterium]|nr:methyltransferase domain-containing protein [Verrucomicrobiota bacterium]
MTRPSSDAAPLVRRCPICGQTEPEAFLQKGRLQLVRCRVCSMVYATPVEAELASGAFYDRLATPFYLSPDKLESDYASVRFARELRLFRRHCARGRVLDVGCSTGAFLYQLRRRYPADYEGVGTDVAVAALDHAESRGVPVVRAPFLEHDFGNATFDAITFWAVIEHLVEPGRFMRKAAALLRPGGTGFVLVPNLGSLAVRLLGAKYRYLMPDHVNYFTEATLRRFLTIEPEFKVIELGSCHFNPLVIWRDLRGGAERVPDAERARLLKRTTAYKQSGWLAPARWLYAGVERLLGTLGLADNLFAVIRRR